MKKTLAIILFLSAALVFADPIKKMPPLAVPTVESRGFGGTHVAFTDDVFSLLVNPAAMMQTRERRFLTLSSTMYSPQVVFDLLTPLLEGDMTEMLSKWGDAGNEGRLAFGSSLPGFPLSIAWVADGFGLGFWNNIDMVSQVIGTTVKIETLVDFIMPVGFAFKVLDTDHHDLDAGVTGKFFVRGWGSYRMKMMDVLDDSGNFLDGMVVPLIAGFGLDAGFTYRWDIGLSAGLTFDDIATFGGEISRIDLTGGSEKKDTIYQVPFSMNAGVSYDARFGKFFPRAPGWLAKSGFFAALDFRDFARDWNDYSQRNPVLGIGAGVGLNLIGVFTLRAGINEALPAVGLGIDLGAVEFDFAYYGREYGLEPGQMPVAAVSFSFSVRPGAKERNWPWTRASIIGGAQKK
ncbi:MAG: hypothetical protein LBR23_00465 [Spirochaetaceae bacterium]|jgi:hypothetical protein|nr:hypothetical protein [Spirochaetaceae bacterium]